MDILAFLRDKVCDGTNDCPDGSDESIEKGGPCENIVCVDNQHKCDRTVCIAKYWVCDGDKDCLDGSDEDPKLCTGQCNDLHFTCESSKRCIPQSWKCDGVVDCGSNDNSDERHCNVAACSIVEFTCNNSRCISKDLYCNGIDDCKDGSDEIGCSVCNPLTQYFCLANRSCIPIHLRCDKKNDCPDGSDEFGCEESSPVCEPHEFACKNLECIPKRFFCDGRLDCNDGSDEQDCSETQVRITTTMSPKHIGLECEHPSRLCDNNTLCINADQLCDNREDCVDGSDEGLRCAEMLCEHSLECSHTCHNAPEGLVCSCPPPLYLQPDRMRCLEVHPCDSWGICSQQCTPFLTRHKCSCLPGYTLMADRFTCKSDLEGTPYVIFRLDRITVVRVDYVTDGAWPNGITLDYVYSSHLLDPMHDLIFNTYHQYDGTDHHEVMRKHEMLSHPFAITFVVRANKWTGGDVSVIQRTLTQPFDIQILHPSRQPRDDINPCGDNNGGCSHLCFTSYWQNVSLRLSACYEIRYRQPHLHGQRKVLLIARPNEIRGVDLLQPYYHTIPTISVPQVLNPSHLEFLGKNNVLYWSDSQVSEVKRTGLTSGPTETLIDTGIEEPSGLAVDWISNNLFIGSPSGIFACNLVGEYSTIILENTNIVSLAANPTQGKLYWISLENNASIESSAMDGTGRTVLVANLSTNSKSLSIDLESKRLYWISDYELYYTTLTGSNVVKLELPLQVSIAAATVYEDFVYYADDDDQSVHKANKTSGVGDVILRNSTGSVLALKIYDPTQQTGSHPCGTNKGGCMHLCLPIGDKTYNCKCATGYNVDPRDPKSCISISSYLFYSINWEICGLSLNEDNNTKVLGPISRVSMASAIDFVADQELILWADSDHGVITSIKTDGTQRKAVIEQTEGMESVPVDWLMGLAVDWISLNIYWCDPKRDVIEVSRLNGSARYVVLSEKIGKLASLVVDPVVGILVWGGGKHIERSGLDGSNRKLLYAESVAITDVTLDLVNKDIYWCDSEANTIERMKYDGTEHVVLLNRSIENPVALNVFNDSIYWLDSTHDRGSIKVASLTNLSDYRTLLRNVGDSLKDLQIFSKLKQSGTNPCAVNNGGCQQLCLFNGSHPVCACPHGFVAKDGKTCQEYDSFIMYSRVVSIDSIHMTNSNIHNSPYPSIKNDTLMRECNCLTFDYSESRLFYSDIQRGSINSVFFNGTGHTLIVDRQGSVEGLAFEQLHKALYWTCNNDATISRINLTNFNSNRSEVEAIIKLRSQDKPRGIAVDSCGGRVFWTNWNSYQPSIERAFLTGYGRETIVNTDIRMPNALTLDHQAHKIYWGDARLDKIERCEYDGSSRVVLAKITPQHPFALAVYGDFIFWTDWILHAVLRVDKLTGQNVVCLTPSATIQCSCTEGRILADDGRRCLSKLSSCTDDSFRCSDGGCVPFQLTCDSITHCSDGSDEEPGYCGHRSCPLAWFQCVNKRCVLGNLTCNGVDDCGDSSDEVNCSCSDKDHFRCANGECILHNFRCDYDPDCKDASDEMGCGNYITYSLLNNYRICFIELVFIENGFAMEKNDCWDKSDEQNCQNVPLTICEANEFQCGSGECIKLEARCNGRNDCKDVSSDGISSDERHCKGHCRPNEFMCANDGTCISISLHCNGQSDCSDSSDETQCKQCRSDQFKCTSGECIQYHGTCDGQPDCADTLMKPSIAVCENGGWVCDGEADCQDMADEHEELGLQNIAVFFRSIQCGGSHLHIEGILL
ncbi:hypothetical protein FQR65_LT10928 [Abscondita terminalis]|nr:hypothetical protein FQR65_LT10928 [Abscondita terminalis]